MKYCQFYKGTYIRTVGQYEDVLWDDTHFCRADKLTVDEAEFFGVFPLVLVTPPPFNQDTEKRENGVPILVDGICVQTWNVVALTAEEIEANRLAKIPAAVTPRQYRRALIQTGLLDTVNAFIATQPIEVKTDWEYATEIRRDYPGWDMFAAAVGKTPTDVDNIFMLAASYL